ncbi:hypothetical protein EVAR_102382_1 [Eumeta japonica]|uniref:Uncharacterized protein n=1 Tax=Eumeta variegata TaxID=151549 RepID=A0A4C2AEK3_EUMVA|nr:hypothetical protein EVAR_102382_1 [Eumeta japonica]
MSRSNLKKRQKSTGALEINSFVGLQKTKQKARASGRHRRHVPVYERIFKLHPITRAIKFNPHVEIADSHIHQVQGALNNQHNLVRQAAVMQWSKSDENIIKQPQITTDRHACQMSQTNHHQHYPSSYRQASNNGDL